MMRMNNQAIQSPKETEYKYAGDTNNECSRSSQDNFLQYKKISDPLWWDGCDSSIGLENMECNITIEINHQIFWC